MRRRRFWLALPIFVAIIVIAAVVFRSRSRLGNVPGGAGANRPAAGAPAARGMDMPTSGTTPAPGAGAPTARAAVSIDPRRQQLIGVRTVVAKRADLATTIRTVGVVRYDETRLADINVKVEGWIRDLYVDYTGQAVRKGQPLLTLYSPDLLNTENEYLLALKARDQMQQSQIADARERADALVAAARQRLRLWDLTPEQIASLEQRRTPETAVMFRSPVDGVVIDKAAGKGAHVVGGQTLYQVAGLLLGVG